MPAANGWAVELLKKIGIGFAILLFFGFMFFMGAIEDLIGFGLRMTVLQMLFG